MIGRTLKHYVIEAPLGKGGMGEVYQARDTRLERSVALKLLPEGLTRDEDRKRRFLQEARAAAAVTHPAIAQIYDVDEAEGVAFIAMELVPGKTIRQLLQGRELDLLGALTVAIQTGDGLAKAHEAGIVHRDLKPENVMLTPDGHVKILDFGLAKLLEPSTPAGGDEVSRMETVARTQAGMVVGTLSYMSPEQARSLAVDHRSDIFSMGVMIYEMATGRLPFSGRTPLDTLHAIAFEESRAATQIRPNLPASLQRVITRCLRKRPEDRYGSARELVEELKAVRREVETGITAPVSLQGRFLDAWQGLASRLPLMHSNLALVLGTCLVVATGYLVIDKHSAGTFIFTGLLGLFVWRRFRNRRKRMLRWLVQRLRKMPEVRVVAHQEDRIIVFVDKALARTYLRVNTLVDQMNASMYFGQPFTVSVRDDPTPEETRSLFGSSGVVYARQDVLEAEV